MTAVKRLTKELAEITNNPLVGVTAAPLADDDLFKWKVTMDGPKNSPYSGGTFQLLLALPLEYPFKPPTLNFTTKIYHPNVSNDDKGSMCLGILRNDNWKPSCKITSVLEMAMNLLEEPNPDDAVETSIAEEYKNNKPQFEKTAKQWTKQYAK